MGKVTAGASLTAIKTLLARAKTVLAWQDDDDAPFPEDISVCSHCGGHSTGVMYDDPDTDEPVCPRCFELAADAYFEKHKADKEAVAPPGFEKVVKKLKKNKEIDNPWALAWSMKNKGDKPHRATAEKLLAAARALLGAKLDNRQENTPGVLTFPAGHEFASHNGIKAHKIGEEKGGVLVQMDEASGNLQKAQWLLVDKQNWQPAAMTARTLLAAEGLGSAEWIELVKSKLNVGDRKVIFDNYNQYNKTYSTVFINYINLPENLAGGGAESENNRLMLQVSGFGKEEHAAPPSGKVKVELSISAVQDAANGRLRLRGKSGTPEQAAKYVADFLNMVAKEIPPRYTHTKV